MKILQLCHKPPYPPIDGGAIAMNNISQGILNAGHELKIITVATSKHPVNIEELPTDYVAKTNFESVFIDTSIKFKAAFFNLFSNRSYNIERFICEELEQKIVLALKQTNYEFVILEGLFVAPYYNAIRKNFKGKIILRAHNVEYRIWERMSANASNPIKKSYLKLLSKRLKDFEIKTFLRVDAICTMTDIDTAEILKLAPKQNVSSVPSGYIVDELDENEKSITVAPNSLFHIASMNWQPNQEAVSWFLNKVWPKVHSGNKEANLFLAGREMSNDLLDLKSDRVHVVGNVPVAKDFYLSKEIMIVPLLSGSGMRIKIIEGMALGKIIISTSIGAEGIFCTHKENILIADDPPDFANCILKVLSDPEFCKKISDNAKKLIATQYDNNTVCEKMLNFFEEL